LNISRWTIFNRQSLSEINMVPAASRKAHIFVAALALVSTVAGMPAKGGGLGRFACQAERVYGEDGLGKLWANARLIYDADGGTLQGSFDPDGQFAKAGIQLPPEHLFSRLKVETGPWEMNHLTAVQYDSAELPNVQPIVAWLMIETLDEPNFPRFQFFSNTIRAVVTGKCVRE
jgi:hypothetical protein